MTSRLHRTGLAVTVALGLSLIGYKAAGAVARWQTGSLPSPLPGEPLAATGRYLATVWPALAFGVLLAAAVRTFVPMAWLTRTLGSGLRGHAAAAAAAAPLMLCSCCAAPLFCGVYERTRRPGPALAVLLGAPSLNLAALAFTFALFGPRVGAARVAMALLAVVGGTWLAAHAADLPAPAAPPDRAASWPAFARSLGHVAVRTVPAVAVGVLLAAVLADAAPVARVVTGLGPTAAILATATLALPLALPTFFELPLALALLALGLPAGAAAALLFVGPAINLASLLTVARSASWRLAAAVAAAVWAVAVTGGLCVQAI